MYPALTKSHRFTSAKRLVGVAFCGAIFALCSSAQSTTTTASARTVPKIAHAQIKYVSPTSGKQMYEAYCASCHGADGRGNATAAAALTQPPADLTLLASRNGGEFPTYRVRSVLIDQDFYHDRTADTMPVWAPAFKSLQQNHPDIVWLRVHNLVAYLKTMQPSPANAGYDRQ